jgi:hypothetical protein
MKKKVMAFIFVATLVVIGLSSKANKKEGGMANQCCPIWTITVTTSFTGPTISCTTGGEYKCKDCQCPA